MQKLRNKELGRLSVDEFKKSEKLPVIIVLDNVRSAMNTGSIFRTADAFIVEKICCCGITPVPPHRDVLKSALGATETVQWEYYKDTLTCVAALKATQTTIAAVEQTINSLSLQNICLPAQRLALIFGHEMDGVQQEVINQCDYTIEVPQSGTKHSLNIAVCTGIVLWEIYRKTNR